MAVAARGGVGGDVLERLLEGWMLPVVFLCFLAVAGVTRSDECECLS
jgi:hypothetical protein